MLKEQYYKKVEELQQKLRETQDENIYKAAKMMAEAIINDGCIHLYDTGHLIDSELLNRAGGFELMKRFRYGLEITSDGKMRNERKEAIDSSLEGLAELALRNSDVLPGDVIIIGSVSGKTINVIDLALACKEMGIKVIAVTSITYSSQVESMHSSGKRLYEIADITLDNCAPYGDAMMEVEGIEAPFIPASGLAAAYMLWALNADLLEILMEKGVTPGILKSVNFEPNRLYNKALGETYKKSGY